MSKGSRCIVSVFFFLGGGPVDVEFELVRVFLCTQLAVGH